MHVLHYCNLEQSRSMRTEYRTVVEPTQFARRHYKRIAGLSNGRALTN